ncbi:hypothetical protein VT84_12175 [Gemmata sp. SH-PL17]|uniref:hypothetical protein n=1 Tax=Gemmata sp. SH-PL17 TaxID=1630693 RepID=UPI00078E7CC2|nr:hypothetical protein [Gemmata sp. SH-PL17]AMV25146.1 hypothetical protein VT84_12175 [Gemmata sp. SH-PL17]
MSLEPGMSLFVAPENGRRYFHVEYAQVSYPIFPGHANAFKTAAEMLIDQYLGQTFNNDSLVFPVLTLYRHSVEIVLKDLVRLGLAMDIYDDADLKAILGKDYKAGELSRDAVLTKHKLPPLWCYTLKLITSVEAGDERVAVAAELIDQFHAVDEDGQTLRYDRDARTLRWTRERFKDMPQVIDVANLRHVANALFDYLEDWHSYITDLRSSAD